MPKIYTKVGDAGKTSLLGKAQVSKALPEIETYGLLDELNAHFHYWLSILDKNSLLRLQSVLSFDLQLIGTHLFWVGSRLSCASQEIFEQYQLKRVSDFDIQQLEKSIDQMNQDLSELNNFILPGGHPQAAYSHIIRTVCRRVERQMVRSKSEVPFSLDLELKWINRLSDFFFVLARYLNFIHQTDDVSVSLV